MVVDLQLRSRRLRIISAHAPTEVSDPSDEEYVEFLSQLRLLIDRPVLLGIDANCRLSAADYFPLVGRH
eukprot:10738276-Prorocentrum_lima.AAC.1